MGAVFEAEHTSIARHVAIKVLHPEYAVRQELVQRFFNEARAVNLVEHPGLVQISDYGQAEDGTAYIVMELLRGEPLSKRLHRSRALSVADTLRLGRQIAATLSAVHAKGIVHRDLKPDNIMVVPDAEVPGGERCKLLDFGIAKLRAADQPEGSATKTSFVMGTPRYMAPEQCRSAKLVDDRSDVYSFGVLLFEMLAGRPPFVAEHQGDLLGMHMFQTAPPLLPLAPQTPPALAELVTRMLAKEPQLRPSMQDVLAWLDRSGAQTPSGLGLAPVPWLDGTEEHGTPRLNSTLGLATGEPAPSHLRRRHLIVGLLVVLSVSVLTVAGGLLLRQSKGQARPAHAVGPLAPESTMTGPTMTGPTVTGPAAERSKPHVRWQLTSQPSGAQVVRTRDGAVLGQTPLRHSQEAGVGSETLVLQLAGYEPAILTLDRDSHGQVERILKRLPSAEKAPSPPVPEPPPASPRPTSPAPGTAQPPPRQSAPPSTTIPGKKESHAPPTPRREDFLER